MQIPITRGMVAVIDDADYPLVQRFSWSAVGGKSGYYARAHELGTERNSVLILMHRLILGLHNAPRTIKVDHINGDTLDNRRKNLRIATHQQNCANRFFRLGASGFKGVCKRGGAWLARVGGRGHKRHVGYYKSAEEAARAYDDAARALFGDFARLNFPRDGERGA